MTDLNDHALSLLARTQLGSYLSPEERETVLSALYEVHALKRELERLQRRERGRTPIADRFWAKVDKSAECWLWTAGCSTTGYGQFWDGFDTIFAHRVAWTLVNGEIPDGLFVLHRCDVPKCVRPEHLFLGTIADNVADMDAKGRRAVGEELSTAKLTEQTARELHAAFTSGSAGLCELARQHSVAQSTVRALLSGRTWKHLNLSPLHSFPGDAAEATTEAGATPSPPSTPAPEQPAGDVPRTPESPKEASGEEVPPVPPPPPEKRCAGLNKAANVPCNSARIAVEVNGESFCMRHAPDRAARLAAKAKAEEAA